MDDDVLVPRIPADLRAATPGELSGLAGEIRAFLIDRVHRSGGHLGPNLGVVELTLALHRVFDSPRDAILFDTGHQTYVHKILTGRAAGFDRLRRRGGLSGYPCRAESPHDWIESSHASAALSYGTGLATAFARDGGEREVVVVVGDGALTGGMCWEALNDLATDPRRRITVVLNDNGHTYSPTVGGIAEHLRRLRAPGVPAGSSTVFDDIGLGYTGPVDGHDVAELEAALRASRAAGRPGVVHVVTTKGLGCPDAERHPERRHQVSPQPVPTASGEPEPGWNDVFAAELVRLGERRDDVVALTAGMPGPTGVAEFGRRFPDRAHDVGIAEQHAVTMAAGLAAGGLHPVVALYSTFLNRAFDQLLMDVALLGAPVTVVLQRAGVTGEDGPSHHGVWDMALLSAVPGLRVAAPRDAATLAEALAEAVDHDGPTVVRFPKGTPGPDVPAVRRDGVLDVLLDDDRDDDDGDRLLLVGVGVMAETALTVAGKLAALGIRAAVVDPRRPLPVPDELVDLAATYPLVVTLEDGVRAGGAGSCLAAALRDRVADTAVHDLAVPGRFLEHGRRDEVLADLDLDVGGVVRRVTDLVAAGQPPIRRRRAR